jgi:hypothetical protein
VGWIEIPLPFAFTQHLPGLIVTSLVPDVPLVHRILDEQFHCIPLLDRPCIIERPFNKRFRVHATAYQKACRGTSEPELRSPFSVNFCFRYLSFGFVARSFPTINPRWIRSPESWRVQKVMTDTGLTLP